LIMIIIINIGLSVFSDSENGVHHEKNRGTVHILLYFYAAGKTNGRVSGHLNVF